jgi:transposase
MSKPLKFTAATIRSARQTLSKATTIDQLRAAQAVLLPVDHGLSRTQTALALGVGEATVGRWLRTARAPAAGRGKAAATPRPWGGRRRSLLTVEEEKAFLEPWARQACSAGMLIVGPLRAALAQRLGRSVRASVVYRLLERHGWRKISPDTRHPKSDPARQEEWKKNSRRWWPMPPPPSLPRVAGVD